VSLQGTGARLFCIMLIRFQMMTMDRSSIIQRIGVHAPILLFSSPEL
jgi:hypothetical protein